MREIKICPKCGKEYDGYPALSREDNETYICPSCGIREALERINVPDEEIDHIVNMALENNDKFISSGD